MDRRTFLAAAAGGLAALAAGPGRSARSRVVLVKTGDRGEGVRRAIALSGLAPPKGSVLVKPNLNSDDPAPGSTHPEVLRAVVDWLVAGGVTEIAVGDRSGMGETRAVMKATGVLDLCRARKLRPIVFDDLAKDEWVHVDAPGGHWTRGFPLARPVRQAGAVISLCCLKTHQFGGHFTLSLKNSVGLLGKRVPGDGHDYMRELHRSPAQREMIAEANAAYRPHLVVLDGVQAFVKGGPHRGEAVDAEVVLAGTDRVALDAVGVALLRHHGTTPEVMRGRIFEQEQIARAAALGLGAKGPNDIEIVTADKASAELAALVRRAL